MKLTGMLLLLCAILLVGFGIVMLTSVGDVQGMMLHNNSYKFPIQQGVYALVSLVCCAAMVAVKPSFWFRRSVIVAMLVAIVFMLVAVRLPFLSHAIKGAYRWIQIGPVSVQPSEFVKVMVIMLISWLVGRPECHHNRFMHSIGYPGILLSVVLLGFVIQKDIGSCCMLTAVNLTLLFIGGTPKRYLFAVGFVVLLCLCVYVANDPERMSRISGWGVGNKSEHVEMSQADKDDTHQVRMSLAAFASGGLWGKGFGKSIYKYRYLPENHTDFILAMVGEEFGLLGTGLCMLVYISMFCLCMRVVVFTQDTVLRLMTFGLAVHVYLSAFVNVCVVTDAAPTKGLALPLLSYGGSNLMGTFVALGLILSVCFRNKPKPQITAINQFEMPATDIWSDDR